MERLRRAGRWLCCGRRFTAIAMAILAVYYAVIWGAFQGKAAGDGWFAFLYLKAIVFHGTVDMKTVAPEYLKFFGEFGPWHAMPNRCPFGPTLLWLPFYIPAILIESLLHLVPNGLWRLVHLDPRRIAYGETPFDIWVTGLGTLLAVLVGWRQTLVLYRRHVSIEAAEIAAALTIWATPMLWYTAHHSFYQHGPAFAVVAILINYWDETRGRNDLRRFVYLGLLVGYGMSVRGQEIVWLAPIGVEIVYFLWRGPERRRWLVGGLMLGAMIVVAMLPQLLVWYYYSGKPLPVQAEPLRLKEPFPLVVLFSTRAGIFPWTPAAYASTLGLAFFAFDAFRRRVQRGTAILVGGMALAVVLDFYIVASAWMVTTGFAYGSRRLSDCSIFFGIGVAFLLDRWVTRPRLRRALVWFLAFTTVLNVTTIILLHARKMSSPGSITRSMAQVLEYDFHAPSWMVEAARYVGYPFVQPAGWIWAAIHHTRPAVFEVVEGTFMLDRDGQWMTVLDREIVLTRKNRDFVASGMRWTKEEGPAEMTTGDARIFLPMFAKEIVDLTVVGNFLPGTVSLTWNGTQIPVVARPGRFTVVVPKQVVNAGPNEVLLHAPVGSTVTRFEFGSRGGWW
jgi:hypothetical protein